MPRVPAAALALAALLALAPAAGAQPPTPAAPAAAAPLPADSVALVHRYTEWFYTGQMDSLFARYTDALRAEMGSSEVLLQTLTQLATHGGSEAEVLEERWMRRGRGARYFRVARFTRAPEPVVVGWSLTPEGRITYLTVALRSQVEALDEPPR